MLSPIDELFQSHLQNVCLFFGFLSEEEVGPQDDDGGACPNLIMSFQEVDEGTHIYNARPKSIKKMNKSRNDDSILLPQLLYLLHTLHNLPSFGLPTTMVLFTTNFLQQLAKFRAR